ncbi:MAG TPA: glycosyltransferase family 4 protein [Reyranella sp.]|nr:glycosyltransferase family 4 protein [Reyranella sp.]
MNKPSSGWRIAIHDYCGHPFQFELSQELARRGHTVKHFFFAEDPGPKGNPGLSTADSADFALEPISIGRAYSKKDLVRRRQADLVYGRLAADKIAAFAPDVTISGNTPLEAQALILRSAHRVGSAFVFWMQDFYSLAAARILSRKIPVLGRLIGAYFSRLEARMLRESDGIVLISDDFRKALRSLDVPDSLAEVIPNWGALRELPVRPKDTEWSRRHGLADKFALLYSGTLALKHNPDLLWSLAKHFEEDGDVAVAVAASGVSYDTLKERRAAEQSRNLALLPLQPMEVFPDVLGSADVVVALLENDAGPYSVPSKVLNYMCAGRPILLSAPADNLSARLVASTGAGVCVPAGDPHAFVEAAQWLRNRPQERAELGAAGRRYAENAFNIGIIADRFEKVFATAIAQREESNQWRSAA